MNFLSLFSGIGGFDLGFERAGMTCIGQCEIDPYAQKVLNKHWPDVPIFEDVTKIDKTELDKLGVIDVLCGGFPCQDLSVAGKQKGLKNEDGTATRSGLFDEIIRITGVCRPRYIILENVANLLSRTDWFGYVLGRLAEIGYDAEWEIIRASDVGAPHKRARIWIVAYPKSEPRNGIENNTRELQQTEKVSESRNGGGQENVADSNEKRLQGGQKSRGIEESGQNGIKQFERFSERTARENWSTESPFCGMADGIPKRVDRLKCLGNALIPQIAEYIGDCIIKKNIAHYK